MDAPATATRVCTKVFMSYLLRSDPFADLQIPESLQESLERHRDNLLKFLENLQSVGVSESQSGERVADRRFVQRRVAPHHKSVGDPCLMQSLMMNRSFGCPGSL